MAKRVLPKRVEDAELNCVRLALEAFDLKAAIGTYSVDRAISNLLTVRFLPENPHRVIRRQVYDAGKSALGWKYHKTIAHPRNEAATRNFLAKLSAIVELDAAVQAFDVDQIFSVTHRYPDQSDDPLHLEGERIGDDVTEIRVGLKKSVALIKQFLILTYIPKFKKDGNRTDLFPFHFIQQFAVHWPQMFGSQATPEDLPHMTILIASALKDLCYPLSRTQLNSDGWLSDRIRKQIFRN
jgi:hypothetical protein